MKRSAFPWLVLGSAALLALLGAGLRVYQQLRCMTEDGLIVPGSRILYGLLGFAVFTLAVTAFFCTRLNRVRGGEHCLVGSPVFLFLDLAACVLLFFSCLLRMMDGGAPLLCICGMAAALCLTAAALFYGKGVKAAFWLVLLPCAYLAAQLISDFKGWSSDPLVIDFCFRLLAQVCAMLALFHYAGFLLGYGQKRMSVFWSVCAFVFAATSLPDYFLKRGLSADHALLLGGLALLCASHALRLLRPSCQEETPSEEPSDAPPAPAPEPPEDKEE